MDGYIGAREKSHAATCELLKRLQNPQAAVPNEVAHQALTASINILHDMSLTASSSEQHIYTRNARRVNQRLRDRCFSMLIDDLKREFKLFHMSADLEDKISPPQEAEQLQPDLVASDHYRCVLRGCEDLDPKRTADALLALGRNWTSLQRLSSRSGGQLDPLVCHDRAQNVTLKDSHGFNDTTRPALNRLDDRRFESSGAGSANQPRHTTRLGDSYNGNSRKAWKADGMQNEGSWRDVQEPPRNNTIHRYYDRSDTSKRKAPLLSSRETRDAEGQSDFGSGAFQTASKRFATEKSQKEGNSNSIPYTANGDGVRAPYKPPARMGGGGGPNTMERLSTRAVLGNRGGLSNSSRSEIRNTQTSNTYASNRNQQSQKKGNSAGDDVGDEVTMRVLENFADENGNLPEQLSYLPIELIDRLIVMTMNKIDKPVHWDDIAGVEHAKTEVEENIVWPMRHPEWFSGARVPSRGMLLFGPPGTGKTLIGKAIATECQANFFFLSSSDLTSKFIGDGEKTVRALFTMAACKQPSVIFIDEVDSLLSVRKAEGENEASRRMKTEFLVCMDGFSSSADDRIMIIGKSLSKENQNREWTVKSLGFPLQRSAGATNRPEDLDDAARRRLSIRLFVNLPNEKARKAIVVGTLKKNKENENALSSDEIDTIVRLTKGYSGDDLTKLLRKAAMNPVRELAKQRKSGIQTDQIRALKLQDVEDALRMVRPSVRQEDIDRLTAFNEKYGMSVAEDSS